MRPCKRSIVRVYIRLLADRPIVISIATDISLLRKKKKKSEKKEKKERKERRWKMKRRTD